ncbi:MAG: DUF2933 domain-containing protein [Burkholderiales bacterium]
MNWLSENWIWIVVGVAFVAMHIFGHGGHGGHGGGGDEGERKARKDGGTGVPGGRHRR